MRILIFLLSLAYLLPSCSDHSTKHENNKQSTDTVTTNNPAGIMKTSIEIGDTKTLNLIFTNYEEGDYPHLLFKETGNSGAEAIYDFRHPDENKLNNIPIVIADTKTAFGYRVNSDMVGKEFIAKLEYKKLSGNDLDGEAMEFNDWRIVDLKYAQ